jgi:putative OPT family oligopeptide transporter
MRELTIRAVLCGLLFGVLFGAANAYLGLKAGLTVSTSIPIAVLTVMALRASRQKGTILEANLSQTIGSASSSLASGTIFTIPALYMWGLAPSYAQIAVLALLGGLLGILAMIPLRRLLIVQADAELPYPEGRACAEVLRASESGAGGGSLIVVGLLIGALVKVVTTALHWLPEEVAAFVPRLPNAKVALAIAPALLGVGYVVGFRASSVMVAGSLIAALTIFPLITVAHGPATAGTATRSAELLTWKAVKDGYALYVGAGAIAAAGLFTVLRSAPTMVASFRAVLAGLRRQHAEASPVREDRDLPPAVLVVGLVVIALVVAFVPGVIAGELDLGSRVLAAAGVVVFGFLFVPVSSRLVGVIGVSSNPTSAMALITLLGTSLVFLACNLSGPTTRATVLTIATIVCVAASKAGDISQDLKTGYLVKGTPAAQQVGQLLAACVACWAVAGVVWAIGSSKGFVGEGAMPAPQATLMKTVVEAVLGDSLPWPLVLSGAGLGVAGILAGLPGLPLALGIYLPFATMATIFVGGVVRRLAERHGKQQAERGVLCASGFVAGEGLAGVLIAGWALATGRGRETLPPATTLEASLALVCLGGAAIVLARSSRKA